MKRQSICILLLLIFVFCLAGCGSKKPKQDMKTESTETQDTKFYTTDEDCYSIETKYGKLEYPEKWKKFTKIKILKEDPYTVQFSCVTDSGKVPLFDLHFGSGEGFLLGTLPQDGKNIPVYLESFDVKKSSLTEEEYNTCCAMEEDVNVVISRLIEKNSFILSGNESTPEQTEDNDKVFAIKTKYGKLSYPVKWKKLVKVEIADKKIYTVKFSTETTVGKTSLFDLTFNGGDGYCLGSMKVNGKDVTIYINDYSFDQDKLSKEEYFNCCAMQEDVNVILEHLTEDYKFAFN